MDNNPWISAWLDKNCEFFINSKFLVLGTFLWDTLYIFINGWIFGCYVNEKNWKKDKEKNELKEQFDEDEIDTSNVIYVAAVIGKSNF